MDKDKEKVLKELDKVKQTVLELEKRIENFDLKEEGCKVWTPKEGELIYILFTDGDAIKCDYCHGDKYKFDMGNIFKTKKEAEFEKERCKIHQELKLFAEEHNEYEIDWNDFEQPKHYLVYDFDFKQVNHFIIFARKSHNTIYFTSEKVAKNAINHIGADKLKKYYFGVGD